MKAIRAMILAAALGFSAGGAFAQTPAAGPISRLITLGTRSGPTPAAGRAQSSNLLIVDKSLYVVDAGPGVMRRLVRAKVNFRDIENIFLTHGHNDHTGGLGELITVIYSAARTKPAHIWGPPGTEAQVNGLLQAYMIDSEIRISDGTKTIPINRLFIAHDVGAGQVFQDANVKVTSVENSHFHFPAGTPGFGRYKSYAYRFDAPDRSIVFTGDTGPSEAVAGLARGADYLVSEVNSLDDYKQLQIRNGRWANLTPAEREGSLRHMVEEHISTEQVGKMAQSAGVKTVILTHLPATLDPNDAYERFIPEVNKYYTGRVLIAKDLKEF